MKFKYGNYDGIALNKQQQSSMEEQFINTDCLSKDMSLFQVAENIKQLLKLEVGEIELIIGFRYKKVVGKVLS